MDMDLDSLKKGVGLVEKCVCELFKKNDLTPAETKAALDGMQLREMLLCEIEDCKMKEQSEEGGYSGVRAVPRHYTMTAYGRPSYGVHGWYENESRRSYGGYPREGYYGDDSRAYSRHSIGDRAVEKLEGLMDTAKSEYEREELHKFIRKIRQEAD